MTKGWRKSYIKRCVLKRDSLKNLDETYNFGHKWNKNLSSMWGRWGVQKETLAFHFRFARQEKNGRRSSAFNSISLWGSVRFEGDETGRENDPNLLQLLSVCLLKFSLCYCETIRVFLVWFCHQMSDSYELESVKNHFDRNDSSDCKLLG